MGTRSTVTADRRHIKAAEGWLEFGAAAEALRELEQLSYASRCDLEVFRIRYAAFAIAEQWNYALLMSEVAVQLFAEHPEPWVWRAHATRVVTGSALRARDALLPATERFSSDALIALNLAFYEIEIGDSLAAGDWLTQARSVARTQGNLSSMRDLAYQDPRLRILWSSLDELDEALVTAAAEVREQAGAD